MLVTFCNVKATVRFYRRNSFLMAADGIYKTFSREALGKQTVTKHCHASGYLKEIRQAAADLFVSCR